ncbi:MAG: hypothetical protein K8S55_14285 [Phycisphaerae bacterium]|nr:hypothetical protein [Phycisphaerae bacterium]
MNDQTVEDTSATAGRKFELTKSEMRTLQSFRRQYKARYVVRGILVILLLYCVGIGVTSGYYAYQMFRGGEVALDVDRDMPSTQQSIEKYLGQLRPYIQKIDFFNLGWTSILHSVLLFYIASRAFIRLRRWKIQNPRAGLAIKLANRLTELGELPQPETNGKSNNDK